MFYVIKEQGNLWLREIWLRQRIFTWLFFLWLSSSRRSTDQNGSTSNMAAQPTADETLTHFQWHNQEETWMLEKECLYCPWNWLITTLLMTSIKWLTMQMLSGKSGWSCVFCTALLSTVKPCFAKVFFGSYLIFQQTATYSIASCLVCSIVSPQTSLYPEH